MTPYQRGSRDALLNAASLLDGMRDLYAASADRFRTGRGYRAGNPTHVGIVRRSEDAAEHYSDAAEQLRRLAEAMPEDPEAGDVE